MPPFLYKYYPWDPNYDEFRINGGLYFASPAKFNDLLDCNMPIVNNINECTKDQAFRKIKELYPAYDVDTVYSDIVNNSQWRIEEYYRRQQDKLGILCLSERHNNPVLWAYYSSNNGYCIKYDASQLLNAIKQKFKSIMPKCGSDNWDPDKRIFSGRVNYKENAVSDRKLFFDNPLEDCKNKYWTKFEEWSKEEEYRIGVSLGGNLKIEVPECVREVILGCNPDVDKYIRALALYKGNKSQISCLSIKNGSYCKEKSSSTWPKEYLRNLFTV